MSGMNMGYYGPARLAQQGHQTGCRFLGEATALGPRAHPPGDLGRVGRAPAHGQCHLRSVFGATVVLERDPVILKVANSWLILNVGGGPTDDKPTVTLAPPADPGRTSAFLNIRVADIAAAYAEWSAKGAEFLTEPKDHAHEIRAYIGDPDGHLIEVGQAKAPPG